MMRLPAFLPVTAVYLVVVGYIHIALRLDLDGAIGMREI